ncbi:MAG: oxidative damage protection protein [Candidatus Endonucleobacter bathymodioli]|uniref:Probable Fe(2+)-trafficking protein n=1 Tax=Candidatus Endonucleibacter bathymodioli TaxID=539814 RepID=A0AA90NMR4_9GAMM|nr:oxidative damage protection protein [Candidatus Endonucleobacter bathymodioli]
MTRTVHCVKLKKEAAGLLIPPLPGQKGQWVFENISQQAWTDWQIHQTRLINEKRLNLLDIDTRKYLTEQMDKYFANENIDAVDGYVPKDQQ